MNRHSVVLVPERDAQCQGASKLAALHWRVEKHTKPRVSRTIVRELQRYVFPVLLAAASLSMVGASCGKKRSADPEEAKDVVKALDDATGIKDEGPKKPISGVKLDQLDKDKKALFEKLVDSLPSPCGKAHSLRTSANADASCKRALYAARYVAYLLAEEYDESEIKDLYDARYKDKKVYHFELTGRPHSGPPDAKVVIVEFYDYECPACREVRGWLDDILTDHPNDAVLYYKQFPIAGHVHSRAAAQAALAAAAQGKFKQMHEILFARQGQHTHADLWGYARQLGLDMAKFETDYENAASMVQADYDEGDKADITGTPTIYINGRMYDAPLSRGILEHWVEEEIAVNQ